MNKFVAILVLVISLIASSPLVVSAKSTDSVADVYSPPVIICGIIGGGGSGGG